MIGAPAPFEGIFHASVGVANFPEHASDAEGLFRAADTAGYAIKRSGENTVGVAVRVGEVHWPREVRYRLPMVETRLVVVASKGGMADSRAWYHNMMAAPDVEVEVGSSCRPMCARRALEGGRAALWPRLVAIYPDYDDYQARTTRVIPVVILSPR